MLIIDEILNHADAVHRVLRLVLILPESALKARDILLALPNLIDDAFTR
jgi:hypothetical protein